MPLTRFLWVWIQHKIFVMQAGFKLGVPWYRLMAHDWSKVSWAEWPHYARRFYGDGDDSAGFLQCWVHHQNCNPHHWQWWIDRSTGQPIPMPMDYVREMVADWLAAGRAYEGRWPDLDNWTWLEEHWNTMLLHPTTRKRVEHVVKELKGQNRGEA